MRRLVWISLHYATFGLEVEEWTVKIAPPIAKWTENKDIREVIKFYKKKDKNLILEILNL